MAKYNFLSLAISPLYNTLVARYNYYLKFVEHTRTSGTGELKKKVRVFKTQTKNRWTK